MSFSAAIVMENAFVGIEGWWKRRARPVAHEE